MKCARCGETIFKLNGTFVTVIGSNDNCMNSLSPHEPEPTEAAPPYKPPVEPAHPDRKYFQNTGYLIPEREAVVGGQPQYQGLDAEESEALNAGLEDYAAGRVRTLDEVEKEMHCIHGIPLAGKCSACSRKPVLQGAIDKGQGAATFTPAETPRPSSQEVCPISGCKRSKENYFENGCPRINCGRDDSRPEMGKLKQQAEKWHRENANCAEPGCSVCRDEIQMLIDFTLAAASGTESGLLQKALQKYDVGEWSESQYELVANFINSFQPSRTESVPKETVTPEELCRACGWEENANAMDVAKAVLKALSRHLQSETQPSSLTPSLNSGESSGDCPAEKDEFLCTLGSGHKGDHEAGGSEPLVTWANDPSSLTQAGPEKEKL
jgi:hypothetical protein